jgi:hypothetical protein
LQYGNSGGSAGPFQFNIYGAGSDFEAWAALRDYTSITYLGLIRSNIAVKQNGPAMHKGTVAYSSVGPGGGETATGATPPTEYSAPTSTGGPSGDGDALGAGYEFGFTVEQVKRTQSKVTRYGRAKGDLLADFGNAPDYHRAVGVSQSGGTVKVEGYDGLEPVHTWSRTINVNPMTLGHKKRIRDLVGTANERPFYGAARGEVLLYGVSGRQVQGNLYTLTFTFHERKNVLNLVLVPDPDDEEDLEGPGALVIPEAYGWDHIWVVYDEAIAANELLNRPIYAYVERVVDLTDFRALRIGE